MKGGVYRMLTNRLPSGSGGDTFLHPQLPGILIPPATISGNETNAAYKPL